MPKAKLIMTICAGALALSAFASTQLATAQWMVNRTTLNGTQTKALATTAAVDESVLFKAAGVTIKCAGSTLGISGAQLTPAGEMVDLVSLIFTECFTNENCKITKSLSTTPILIHVDLDGPLHTLYLFLPKTKNTFATISYEGEKCALLGTQPLTGKFTVTAPTGQEEKTLQEIEAAVTEGSSELKIGSSSAELKGKALLKLVSGETWSFL
jgi:hypothetical protein